MIPTTLAQVAHATGAVVPAAAADLLVSRVTTDSRDVTHGDLFVAIAGERHDGHDHAAEAVARGATAVLAQRDLADVLTLQVQDTVVALGRLAHDLLARLQAHGSPDVVAVTGSVGKTSTKDLLAQVLAASGPTIAPPGSFNNDIGLPSTVLRCDRSTRYLVLEMGSRGLGHVARLTEVARPRVGVVLGVGSAHLGEFGSVETIARAKAELVQALPGATEGGVAVLNGDDARVRAMAELTAARVVTYGTSPGVDVRASQIRLDSQAKPSFRLHLGGQHDVTLHLTGEPAVGHALASVAAATALGVDVEQAVAAVRSALPVSPGRMAVTTTADGVVVVDDSYNASPESVTAALRSIVAMARPPGARTWAVLGEMRELGASSVTEHRAVGRLATQLGLDRLVVVGDAANEILHGATDEGGAGAMAVTDASAAIAVLTDELQPGDRVLVKASRAVGLDQVVAALVGGPAEERS